MNDICVLLGLRAIELYIFSLFFQQFKSKEEETFGMDDNDSDHDGSEVDEENFDGSEMEFDISDEDTDIEANQGWYKLQYCFRLCLGIA